MGCRLTKDELLTMHANELPSRPIGSEKIDYKSRLERKMCLARETPELNFDLSDCNLKDVPSGVFVLCRVLRKESLDLSKNRLTSLNGGGILNDLHLLQVLDLRYNKIKQLPDEIYKLENLRELLISNNLLIKLPKTINILKYLELLDISCNNIQSINEINFMPRLKILNLNGNKNLKKLPNTLGTCDNLCDLIIDYDNIEWPSINILQLGTLNIIKYLTTGEITKTITPTTTDLSTQLNVNATDEIDDTAEHLKKIEIGEEVKENYNYDEQIMVTKHNSNQQRSSSGWDKIRHDFVETAECESTLIRQFQMRQQKQKEELLQVVLNQQHETEFLVHKIQQQKDNEKNKLIKDVLQAEENANLIIENLLALKNTIDCNLLEMERLEEKRLLENLHLNHSELRKQEILLTMLDTLHDEECKIQDYQNRKLTSSQDILERELETTTQLEQIFQNYEKNRNDIIQKICEDEELQKKAVINLISKNDARSWGLVEQLRIVEAQLANMTQLEIQKRQISTSEQMNELSDKRIFLTKVLMDLLDQQEDRRKQLLNTILSMEAQKCNEQDFWLLQYQRLLDSRPLEFSVKTHNSIDPLLGYNFLVNGVIHCLPFLQKLWQNNDINLEKLTNDDLKLAGIREERDRKLILKSIREFLHDLQFEASSSSSNKHESQDRRRPSAPPLSPSFEKGATALFVTDDVNNFNPKLQQNSQNLPECVICMEEWIKIIFLPCGHMCCCLNCQTKVSNCPICRANIERKVKIVQP